MTAVRKLLAFLSFRRISGQIAMLITVSLITIHFIITAVFIVHRKSEPPRLERPRHEISTLVQLVSATPAPERAHLLDNITHAYPELAIEFTAIDPDNGRSEPRKRPHGYPFHLPAGFHVFMVPGTDDRVGVRMPDGALLTARLGPERSPPLWGGPWIITLLFVIVSITLLGVWAARALSTPLSAFAKAAESFSLSSEPAPLPESGPAEIRAVAKALNRMRERIITLTKDRTRMFAAIGHDLRTPITRLRLRSEFIEDETHRHQMLGDLDQMRSMLESVLSFLRNDHTLEPMTLVDLTAILQQIGDQFADLGHKVSYRGPAHLTITARPDDLHRAVTNLVENAVKFGAVVVIGLSVSGDGAVIDVEDDGPGIDDTRKAAMLEPFVRGDEARNMDEGGFGLGLSIAQSIILAHGGVLSLHDRRPRGLTARIILPHEIEQKSAA